MTADSRVSNDFAGGREYTRAHKLYVHEGAGAVAQWGERVGPSFGDFLRNGPADLNSVDELATTVIHFLTECFRPMETESSDIGFHVGGFTQTGGARLYHIFWGVRRPLAGRAGQQYEMSDHSPTAEAPLQLVYNGRNDVADAMVQALIRKIADGHSVPFDLRQASGMALLGNFIARTASELTPEVGPPFSTAVVLPGNRVSVLDNEHLTPPHAEELRSLLAAEGVGSTLPVIGSPELAASGTEFTPSPYSRGTVTIVHIEPNKPLQPTRAAEPFGKREPSRSGPRG